MTASKGPNPISNNSYSIIHRDRLLTISNIHHANIIFFISCFRITKLIWHFDNLCFIFFSLSISIKSECGLSPFNIT